MGDFQWDRNALDAGVEKVWGKADGWKIIPPALYPNQYNFRNMRGVRQGRVKFLEYVGKLKKNRCGRWLVRCDCGRHAIMSAGKVARVFETIMCRDCDKEQHLAVLNAAELAANTPHSAKTSKTTPP